MMRNSTLAWRLPCGMLVLSASTLAGQPAMFEDQPHIRARCAAAVSALQRRDSVNEFMEAYRTIGVCDRSGAAVLSVIWKRPPADRAEIDYLAMASRQLRDQRIMEVVLATAIDPDAPGDLRLGAMVVMASFVNPLISSLSEDPTRQHMYERFTLAGSAHHGQRDGLVPLEPDYVTTVMDALGSIAATDRDERVAYAAGYVKRALEVYLRRNG